MSLRKRKEVGMVGWNKQWREKKGNTRVGLAWSLETNVRTLALL